MDSLEIVISVLWVAAVFVFFFVVIGMWVGKMNQHRTIVQAFMEEIRQDIRDIRKEIDKIHKGGNARG